MYRSYESRAQYETGDHAEGLGPARRWHICVERGEHALCGRRVSPAAPAVPMRDWDGPPTGESACADCERAYADPHGPRVPGPRGGPERRPAEPAG